MLDLESLSCSWTILDAKAAAVLLMGVGVGVAVPTSSSEMASTADFTLVSSSSESEGSAYVASDAIAAELSVLSMCGTDILRLLTEKRTLDNESVVHKPLAVAILPDPAK